MTIPRWSVLSQQIPLAGIAHNCGTIRFGTDPQRSAVHVNCKAHDVDDLYVVDTSFFPSSSAVNPSLTAIANALRVGDHLLERLGAPRHGKRRCVSGGPGALSADRRPRRDRQPPYGRAGQHRRNHRLVLLPTVRLTEHVRLVARRRPRRPLRAPASRRRVAEQAAVLPRHQRADHPLPHSRRGRGGTGFHARR